MTTMRNFSGARAAWFEVLAIIILDLVMRDHFLRFLSSSPIAEFAQ